MLAWLPLVLWGSGRYFAPGGPGSVDSEFGNMFAHSFDYPAEGMDALYIPPAVGGPGSVDSEYAYMFAYSFDYPAEGMDALYISAGGGGPFRF